MSARFFLKSHAWLGMVQALGRITRVDGSQNVGLAFSPCLGVFGNAPPAVLRHKVYFQVGIVQRCLAGAGCAGLAPSWRCKPGSSGGILKASCVPAQDSRIYHEDPTCKPGKRRRSFSKMLGYGGPAYEQGFRPVPIAAPITASCTTSTDGQE